MNTIVRCRARCLAVVLLAWSSICWVCETLYWISGSLARLRLIPIEAAYTDRLYGTIEANLFLTALLAIYFLWSRKMGARNGGGAVGLGVVDVWRRELDRSLHRFRIERFCYKVSSLTT